MVKLGQRTMKGEKGQVLAGILILLALGTLLIAPALNYASTNLYAGRMAEENMRGGLAADAGVENALWCIMNSVSPPEQLSDVNGMEVTIETVDMGEYALGLYDKVVEVEGAHNDYVVIESVIEGVGPVYQCTITVTRKESVTKSIKLNEVGLRLPPGYAYQLGSAALPWSPPNLSEEEPDDTLDWTEEAHMLTWNELDAMLKTDNPVVTQYFNVTGVGEPGGYYAWVVTNESDIGTVGEHTGKLYIITATATRPGDGEVTGRVVAEAILDQTAEIYVILWKASPQ